MKITNPPPGMPVQCWSVVGPHSPTISGFKSAEAARAWATEWRACPNSIIAPVCSVADATTALVLAEIAYEQEDGPEED